MDLPYAASMAPGGSGGPRFLKKPKFGSTAPLFYGARAPARQTVARLVLGDLKIALRGGGGVDMDARRRRGGVGEMGFRVGPFVLCKNGCWRQRRRNTNFGLKKFFPPIISPPHI